jgi:predicted dehydrogenase
VKRGQIDVHTLSPEARDDIKQTLFQTVLPLKEIKPGEANPLLDEQRDFVASIRNGCAPRVTGQQARDALSAAERILASIARHRWDGTAEGRVGPHLAIPPQVLKGPRWEQQSTPADLPRRKAG